MVRKAIKRIWMLTLKHELTSGHDSRHTSYLVSHRPSLSGICPYLHIQSHLSLGLKDYRELNSWSTNVNRIHFILACVMKHDKKPGSSIPVTPQLLSSLRLKEKNLHAFPMLYLYMIRFQFCSTHVF